jgi:hypothetical protein
MATTRREFVKRIGLGAATGLALSHTLSRQDAQAQTLADAERQYSTTVSCSSIKMRALADQGLKHSRRYRRTRASALVAAMHLTM